MNQLCLELIRLTLSLSNFTPLHPQHTLKPLSRKIGFTVETCKDHVIFRNIDQSKSIKKEKEKEKSNYYKTLKAILLIRDKSLIQVRWNSHTDTHTRPCGYIMG